MRTLDRVSRATSGTGRTGWGVKALGSQTSFILTVSSLTPHNDVSQVQPWP
jgi:hypothetical protein